MADGAREDQAPEARAAACQPDDRCRDARGPARDARLGCERPLPQAGGRDRGDRGDRAVQRERERDPAAERVPGNVPGCLVEVELGLDEPAHRHRKPLRRRGLAIGESQRRRCTEPGQVWRDHVALAGQPVQDRIPDVAVGPQRMQEHQRRARPTALVCQRRCGHGSGVHRDGDGRAQRRRSARDAGRRDRRLPAATRPTVEAMSDSRRRSRRPATAGPDGRPAPRRSRRRAGSPRGRPAPQRTCVGGVAALGPSQRAQRRARDQRDA